MRLGITPPDLFCREWEYTLRPRALFLSGSFAEGEDCMTTWFSNSNLSSQTNRARGSNSVVLYAALAVLIAIALYLIVTPGHLIPQDATATLVGS
jgi:hypothetical protein